MFQTEPIKAQDVDGLERRGLEPQLNAGSHSPGVRKTAKQLMTGIAPLARRHSNLPDGKSRQSQPLFFFFGDSTLICLNVQQPENAAFGLPEQFKHSSAVSEGDCSLPLKAGAKSLHRESPANGATVPAPIRSTDFQG